MMPIEEALDRIKNAHKVAMLMAYGGKAKDRAFTKEMSETVSMYESIIHELEFRAVPKKLKRDERKGHEREFRCQSCGNVVAMEQTIDYGVKVTAYLPWCPYCGQQLVTPQE